MNKVRADYEIGDVEGDQSGHGRVEKSDEHLKRMNVVIAGDELTLKEGTLLTTSFSIDARFWSS
jgi:hypothetical protein